VLETAAPKPDDTSDCRTWIERHCQIATEDGRVVPLVLEPQQARILGEGEASRAANDGLVRAWVLKCRRIRASTAISAWSWWQGRTAGRTGSSLCLVSDDEVRVTLDEMTRRYQMLDPACPKPTYTNRGYELVFGVPPNDYRFVSEIADKYSGTSKQALVFHASEVAKWTTGVATRGSLTSAIQHAHQWWESTANGVEGHGKFFHDAWWQAYRGENGHAAIFVPWHEHPHYTLDEGSERFKRVMDKALEREETDLEDAYSLTLGQIAWRRWMIEEFGSDVDYFRQEMPSNPQEAFVRIEGRRVFSLPHLTSGTARGEQWAQEHPPMVGGLEWVVVPTTRDGYCTNREHLAVRFVGREDGPLRVWEPPTDNPNLWRRERYVVAGDVAEGVEGGDWSSACVGDRVQRRVVAAWHGRLTAKEYGTEMVKVACWYSGQKPRPDGTTERIEALVCPESNSAGAATIAEAVSLWSNVWRTRRYVQGDPDPDWTEGQYGWRTTDQSKARMVEDLINQMHKGFWTDPDPDYWQQSMGVIRSSNGRAMLNGKDRVVARCILAALDELMPVIPVERPPEKRQPWDYGVREVQETIEQPPEQPWGTSTISYAGKGKLWGLPDSSINPGGKRRRRRHE
jgi:hypothetical protein